MNGLWQKALTWLGIIGTLTASYITLPHLAIPLSNGKVWHLDTDLPTWALGLIVVVLVTLVLKVITHVLFKLLIWLVMLIVIGLLIYRFLNIPLPLTF